jgi:hypothetical protein
LTPEQIAERTVYVELNRNESRIIVERLRAMLTYEGLLFAAVGVAVTQRFFLLALLFVIAGALSCLPWYKSVRVSYNGMAAISERYKENKPGDVPELDAYNIAPRQFKLLPEVFLPWVIALIWCLIGLVVIYYWAYPPSLPAK